MKDLAGALERYQVTWVELTRSVAELLDLNLLPLIQTLALAGETVGSTMRNRTHFPVTFVNSYGLCETAITNIITSPMSTEFVDDIRLARQLSLLYCGR